MFDDRSEWKQVGEIGVDAGLCWIGDPCYVVAKDSSHVFESWDSFCSQLFDSENKNGNKNHKQWTAGVSVSTGYGDGTYPVFIQTNRDGRCVGVRVDFDPQPKIEECNDCGEEYQEDLYCGCCDDCAYERENRDKEYIASWRL